MKHDLIEPALIEERETRMTRDAAWLPNLVAFKSAPERYKCLDAIRGIAALQVLISHAFLINYSWGDIHHWYVRFTPLRFLLDARVAVITFFVLSGFVLFQMISREGIGLYAYYARRLICIYLPFAAAIFFAAFLTLAVLNDRSAISGMSDIASSNLREVSTTSVARHLLMLGTERDMQLDGPMWSLVQEMRISICYPLLFLAIRSWDAKLVITSFAILSLLALLSLSPTEGLYYRDDPRENILLTVFFVFPFILGSCIAKTKSVAVPIIANRPLAFLAINATLALVYWRLHIPAGLADFLLSLMASCWIIGAITYQPIIRALEHGALTYLGKISYSLYLVHVPVLTFASFRLSGLVGLKSAVLIGASASLLIADIFNRAIELPSHRLARYLAAKGQT